MLDHLRRLLFPLLKPFFFRYWLVQRGMTMGVRVAAFDQEGRICLIKHSYTEGWHFPGGGVEIGESFHQAAIKELFEEAGVSPGKEVELFGLYYNPYGYRRDHVALYVAQDCVQARQFNENFEIAEQGFFALDNLPDDLSQSTRARLIEIRDGRQSDQYW